jgi:hypothetical protein
VRIDRNETFARLIRMVFRFQFTTISLNSSFMIVERNEPFGIALFGLFSSFSFTLKHTISVQQAHIPHKLGCYQVPREQGGAGSFADFPDQ